jgi:hypothetical protein
MKMKGRERKKGAHEALEGLGSIFDSKGHEIEF